MILFVKDDFKRNQFILRIFDLGRFDVNKQYTEYIDNGDQKFNPRYTYHLDQSSRNYDVNSSRIRIQYVIFVK